MNYLKNKTLRMIKLKIPYNQALIEQIRALPGRS